MNIYEQLAIIVPMAVTGGFVYRVRGGLVPGVPRWLAILTFTAAFFLPVHDPVLWVGGLKAVAVWALTFLAVATGHGRWQSLKEPLRGDPERTEAPILWAARFLPVYWYKVLGLAWNGCLILAPLAIATLQPLWLLAGLVKPLAYMTGWMFQAGGRACEIGEALTGFGMWAGIFWYLTT